MNGFLRWGAFCAILCALATCPVQAQTELQELVATALEARAEAYEAQGQERVALLVRENAQAARENVRFARGEALKARENASRAREIALRAEGLEAPAQRAAWRAEAYAWERVEEALGPSALAQQRSQRKHMGYGHIGTAWGATYLYRIDPPEDSFALQIGAGIALEGKMKDKTWMRERENKTVKAGSLNIVFGPMLKFKKGDLSMLLIAGVRASEKYCKRASTGVFPCFADENPTHRYDRRNIGLSMLVHRKRFVYGGRVTNVGQSLVLGYAF